MSRTLSDRDLALLHSVDAYGFLTTRQLEQLHFYDHATSDSAGRLCRRAVARLHAHRLLEPLERRIGGLRAGSSSYVWRLGASGDRLLRTSAEPRARRKEPSTRFLDHRLLVADCACALTVAARTGDFELAEVNPEPASWRPFLGLHGAREILKPDLFALTTTSDYEDHWFIEVDRGTESLPTILKQCNQYERYRRSGKEQQRVGLFPRVVWLVPTDARAVAIRRAITASRDLTADLYVVARHDQLLRVITGGAS